MRDGIAGNGAARIGNASWRRLTEERAGGAKSVFHFDVQGSVAKSTHAGIPWLRFIRNRLGARIHFWPFDGWEVPAGRSVIAEAYPALWSQGFANEGRTGDQHDAYCIAAWLSRADRDGSLQVLLSPELSPTERAQAQVEGCILGVSGGIRTKPISSRVAQRQTYQARAASNTARPGYVNRNRQLVLHRTEERGNDHNQYVYKMRCKSCEQEFGANGSDIWQRRCPSCGGGAPKLAY